MELDGFTWFTGFSFVNDTWNSNKSVICLLTLLSDLARFGVIPVRGTMTDTNELACVDTTKASIRQ
jgi:hypothetical protein